MSDLLALGKYVQEGFDEGRDRKNKATLAKLYSQALGAPEDQQGGYVQQMAAVDPGFANSAQSNFSDQRKQAYDDLGKEAGMFVALAQSGDPATAQQAYQRLAAKAQAAGHPVPPTYDPKMLPMIQKLAETAGGQQQLSPHVIGSDLVDPTGKVLYHGQPAPSSANLVNVPDGNGGFIQKVWDPKARTFSDPQYENSQQTPQQSIDTIPGAAVQSGAALDPTQDYPQLAANFPGTQISSLFRTPEHNAAVGGVANSQHIKGTAGDFVVPKAEQASFIAKAKAEGYEVIPEGDHVHVELPPGKQAAKTFAQGGRLGYTPPKAQGGGVVPSGYRYTADGMSLEPIPGGPADNKADGLDLTPDAIDNAAWDHILTGTNMAIGRGKEGIRQRTMVNNRIAAIAKQAGVSPQELATKKGQYKALQSSLTNIQKQSDMMDKAEDTFRANSTLMVNLSDKVSRVDSPTLNRYILDAKLNWSGDPKTAAYIAAARTAVNEYAKIASAATGSAGSTDTSRREAAEAISTAQNPAQLRAVVQTLMTDAENQKNATHAKITDIGSRMAQFGGAPKPAARVLKFNPATGKIE